MAVPADQVQTDSGWITLEPLEQLTARQAQLRAQAAQLEQQATVQDAAADDFLARAGASLVPRRTDWHGAPGTLQPLFVEADRLISEIGADDAAVAAIHAHDHSGLGGFFARLWDSNREGKLSADRSQAVQRLRALLIQIAAQAQTTGIPEADALLVQAQLTRATAASIRAQASQLSEAADAMSSEISQRNDAVKQMGFDAPYLAASLRRNGPTPVASPLVARRGESAYLVLPCTLARQQTRTHFVGGSQGFSFPIGHTGIRYRVGSYRGHPVQQQFLGRVDNGSLVVTNQRLAFVGATRSVSIPLAKIMHVESYRDGLAVFKEGRESADYFLTDRPQYALFYVNFLLDQPA